MEKEPKLVLCPYCGAAQSHEDRCEECGGLFEPLSRKATQVSMGPWFIRDKNKPFRPGCSYDVLVRQIKAGRVKPTTVLRGPSTRQFWALARNAPGVAHLLGYCHRCGAHVNPEVSRCPECSEPFEAVRERNELGLLYPTDAAAAAGQRLIEQEIEQTLGKPGTATGSGAATQTAGAGTSTGQAGTPPLPGADLLQEILSSGPVSEERTRPPAAGRSTPPSRPASAPPPVAAGLDFSPSEEQPERTSSPATGGMSVTTWLLIIVNLLLLVVVVMLFIYYANAGSPVSQGPSSNSGAFSERPAPPPPSEPAPVAPSRDFASANPQAATPPAGDTASPKVTSDPWIDSVNSAIAMANNGQLAEALAALRDIEQRTTDASRRSLLGRRIAEVEQALSRPSAPRSKFFGI